MTEHIKIGIVVFSTLDPEQFWCLFYNWKKGFTSYYPINSKAVKVLELYSAVGISHNQSAKFQLENLTATECSTEWTQSGFQIQPFADLL